MARARRRPHTSLKADVFERPHAYELFQALAIVEHVAVEENRAAGQPPPDPAGRGVEPTRAALRIRSAVPLGYAAAEVVSVRRPKGALAIELTQAVIGLTGSSGVLPHAFSEMVHVSVRERNPGLRDFLDIFNNRLAGLLYEAWAKPRLTVEHARAARLGTPRPIDAALRALVGIGLAPLSGRLAAGDEALIHFGGHFARVSRSAHAVEQVLSGATGHPVRLEQFHGAWLPIAETDRSSLPSRERQLGTFCRLGHDMVVGARTFDAQSCVQLLIGPLGYDAFRALLPDGRGAQGFADLAAAALGPDMAYRLSIALAPGEVPPLALTRDGGRDTASRLGWNTWLHTERPRRQPASVDVAPAPHLR